MIPDARRLEELSLNSSAPPGQLLYDGWLLRLLPGKPKRTRSLISAGGMRRRRRPYDMFSYTLMWG